VSETRRLINLTLARLREMEGAGSALCQAAWGACSDGLPADHLPALAAELPGPVRLDLSGLAPGCRFPPDRGRILLNLLILAAASLPAGGVLRLAGSDRDLFLQLDGTGAAWPPGLGGYLVDEAAACAALRGGDAVLTPLTALLAHDAGVRLSLLLGLGDRPGPAMLRLGG
jgi:hypothetical protein